MKNKRLGDMLIQQGMISEEQLSVALQKQKTEHKRLGEVLIGDGFITENQLIETLRVQLGIDYIDLTKLDIDPSMSRLIPAHGANKYAIVPVRMTKGTLFLAMADPLNFVAIEYARDTSGKKIVPMIATSDAVSHTISVLYGNEGAAEAMQQMREEAGISEEAVNDEEPREADAPTIRLVNSIIERAITERASDIHFETTSGDMVVRMRIDGRLHRIMTVPSDLVEPVVSRLKIMGKMDIVERRVPQDSRAGVKLHGRETDLRLSTLPTIYGEKVVVRLLGTGETNLTREGIGIPPAENGKLDRLLSLSSGVILIVGPTGSGKTSTMYALMQELLSEETNLITLEDPVEYHIDGATQVEINEKVGLTFAAGLRSVLRQDPDIICVGEIRDGETAEIAMRAAMTGHLVISTIHTEDAVSAVDRLRDMGVEPYLIAAGLRGIISQRLLRRICPNCKTQYTPDEAEVELSKVRVYPGRKYYQGKGCDHCFHTGYRGRIGVFEVLVMNNALRRCITSDGSEQEFRRLAEETDYTSMSANADRMAADGVTSIDEIIRTLHVG
jgi:type IV pilus assembly protein PilB